MLKALLQSRHRRFRRDLSAYVDGMLSERARRRLEAHLDSCQACRQELAELRSTVEALGSLPMAEVPRSFTLAAAPLAEMRPRPAARRLEFGLRLATATAAFVLALVVVGDFAGLPGDGEEEEAETPRMLAPAAAETPEFFGIGEPYGYPDVEQLERAVEETPPARVAAPVETPAAEQTPAVEETPAVEQTPAVEETPAAEQTPAVEETPAAEQTPAVEETPAAEQMGVPLVPAVTEVERPEPEVGAGVSEEEEAEKAGIEGAEVEAEAEAEAYTLEGQTLGEVKGGGLSRQEIVRWLEVGLGAGVGALVVVWAFARFQRSIGNRP